jgi:TIR domain
MFEYDVAISFAGEQRPEAEAIANCLREAGINVFYDRYEKANLWGKDLYEHLSDIYQNKARYCLMLVSAAYAAKVWTTHERKNAQARALSQRLEYILPVRFDETEIPGLPNTVGHLRFKEDGVQGICVHLLKKLSSSSELSGRHTVAKQAVAPEPNEFWEQRKGLADTDILKKILSKPRWRIWIHPTEFRKARFRNPEQCREFVNSSCVRGQGLFPYPWFSQESLESDDEWIAGEIDMSEDGRVSHSERWVLFRSAQFVHYRAFDEIPQLGDRVHVLGILDTATAAFEFAARMAQRSVVSPEAVITFELYGVDGRVLTWPQDHLGDIDAVGRECWCQDEGFSPTRRATVAELEEGRRDLALEVALEIYSKFRWLDPPRDRLADDQHKRFGAV